jgi:transposase
MAESSRIISEYNPVFCNHFGEDLLHEPAIFILRRQVVDITSIIPDFTEHRIFPKTCSCGHHTKASFPNNVNSPISDGSNIIAIIAYMLIRQYCLLRE